MPAFTINATLHKIEQMKVILVGYMGSGKSTVGKAIADKLNMSFVDLDTYIESREKMTISQLFEDKGQIYFRKVEHQYLQYLLDLDKAMVISTGGGAPCYAGNMNLILEASPNVIYLKLSINELIKRLYPEREKRPLIAHLTKEEMPEFFGKHLFERSPFYEKANQTVNCDGKSVSEITEEIEKFLV